MADFSYAWTGPEQVALASAVDQGAQYRQVGFAIIDMLRTLCGYTVEQSSDGGGVNFGAGDFIANEGDIVWGLINTQNHSYALLRPPAGKGNPAGGAEHGIVVDFAHDNADTTPQTVQLWFGSGPVVTPGDANSRPVLQNEENALTTNLIPWTAPIAGSICRWENSNNDFLFGVKANGESFFRFFLILASDPDNAQGTYTLWLFAIGSGGAADAVSDSNLTNGSNFRSLRADGTGPTIAVSLFSMPFELTSWPDGQEDTSNRVLWRDIEVAANGSAVGEARVFGLFRDVLACPRNTPFNQADPDDNGNEAPYEWISVGDLVLPCDQEITI